MTAKAWNSDREYHESLVLSTDSDAANRQHNIHREEIRTTPLFSADVLAHTNRAQTRLLTRTTIPEVLPQYSFMGKVLNTFGANSQQDTDDLLTPDDNLGVKETGDSRLFVNMNAPWSAFICGSQGSGKSHTLSCMLESALKPSGLGKLPSPLAGMVFHYDKFTGTSASQVCEAAYLCSTGIAVTVLVSASNFHRVKRAYENIPGLPPNTRKPVVAPLYFEEKHLNVERMKKLMAIDEKEGRVALYIEVGERIKRMSVS